MYWLKTLSWIAALRLIARKPLGASATSVPLAARTTQEPSFCSAFFSGEKCSISVIGRAPTTISASPRRIGSMSFGMSSALYWLSASVLTMMSAPCAQAGIEPGHEAAREALMRAEIDDVIDAVGARDFDRPVGAAVVDDQPLDLVHARHLARQRLKRDRERSLLVVGRASG